MHPPVAVVVLFAVLGVGGVATAQPERCTDLPVMTYAKLPQAIQEKLASTQRFERHGAFAKLIVTVTIQRAPHIAREILAACPGTHIDDASPIDRRRFQSQVRLRLSSYAALMRLGQLPAVDSVWIVDPDVQMKHPQIDFEDFQ